MIERHILLSRPLSIRQTFGVLRNGSHDPCVRFDGPSLWRATRTPDGPATMLLSNNDDNHLHLRAWGPGAQWCADHLPEFAGEHCEDLPIEDEQVRSIAQQFPGMRIPRLLSLTEMAIPIVLAQRVTTREAFKAYSSIVRSLGDPAPGPSMVRLLLPPHPEVLKSRPSWWFHKFGVDRKRAQTIVDVCKRADAIDRLTEAPTADARAKLLTIPGIGLWTSGTLGLYGLGDHDSVIIGDFHYANHIAWTLTREARSDDRHMLALLDAFRPQRGRVQRLLLIGGVSAPRFGPRYNPLPIATY